MSDEPVAARRNSCLPKVITSLLLVLMSAVAGAALAIGILWYGPQQLGLRLPDATGHLAPLQKAQETAVIERTEMRATLQGLADLRTSMSDLNEKVQDLEMEIAGRDTNVEDIRKQIKANFDSLLALQRRLDELESIPANASLAKRLAEAEVQLATVNTTLERLRQALSIAPVDQPQATQPADGTAPEVTVTPAATPISAPAQGTAR